MARMQVLTSSRADRALVDRPIEFARLLVGLALLGGAVAVAYLAFATPLVDRVMPSGRPEAGQVFSGMIVWAFALFGPAAFGLVGIARVASSAGAILGGSRHRTPAARHAAHLPDDYVVASRLVLGDGRMIPELVVGPFGVAVLEELPPAAATRRHRGTWEIRVADGRWRPIQNPLDRASRDAESVRRWIASDDRDFVVKVHAAVVGPTGSEIPRTPTCAMIGQAQVPAWLAALPPQRTLTPTRRARLLELIQTAL
jgi:hypothetical protein